MTKFTHLALKNDKKVYIVPFFCYTLVRFLFIPFTFTEYKGVDNMKEKINKFYYMFIIFILSFFFVPSLAKAETITASTINGMKVNVRIDAGTEYSNVMAGSTPIQLNTGYPVVLLNPPTKLDSSNNIWYNIQFSYNGTSYTGYVYGIYLKTITYDNDSFDSYLTAQGFPESYWPALEILHASYPNWSFQALSTGLDWNAAVNAEIGENYTDSREVAYRSTDNGYYNWDTDTWNPQESNSWFAANGTTIAYYMDPRNFLTATNILMFESLSYQNAYQTQTVVQKILNGTSMEGSYQYNGSNKTYASTFIDAASQTGVSPIHLASRARQEIGTSTNPIPIAASGASFTYNSQTYSGLYNFYNIGASSGGTSPVYKGLVWANGGETGTTLSVTYNRPWKTRYDSIVGGASYIGEKYINANQNTLYLQKFNVAPASPYTKYTHQYMTNVSAPKSESVTTYNAYSSYGLLNEALVFSIPVFNNMSNTNTLPTTLGNPNNYLSMIKVNGINVPSFNKDVTTYNILLSSTLMSVTIDATKISSLATIQSGTGTATLTGTTTTVNIPVKAENGTIKTYVINITKSDTVPITTPEIINSLKWTKGEGFVSGIGLNTDVSSISSNISNVSSLVTTSITDSLGATKSTGNIGTGDSITITNNGEETTYKTVIYGDVNGDGQITILDLLVIQKAILGSKTLSDVYAKAADPSKDGSITIKDLLKVQKHILGSSIIEQ